MFWPDDISLSDRTWWAEPAWDRGPTWGALVAAVRPAMRTALLLGYSVDGVALGFGQGAALDDEWQILRLDTLELVPGVDLSPNKLAEGPSVWLEASPQSDASIDLNPDESEGFGEDQADPLVGTYAIAFDFALFGSDDYTEDGSVPAAIVAAVKDVVNRAVDELAARLPSRAGWHDAVAAGGGLPREEGGGLAWILDPHHWDGIGTDAAAELDPVVEELLAARDAFLLGQLLDDRSMHRAGAAPGPANLPFLLGREIFWPRKAGDRFWAAVLASLQGSGEAHRLWERERARFGARDSAPNWLDVLGELIGRGVVGVYGLFDPPDPPAPLTSVVPVADGAPDADPQSAVEVTLTVWGRTPITLTRRTVFADQPNEGVLGSVAWDYVPGTDQVKPTVLLVAGRGIEIAHHIDDLDQRPWGLEIFRVQDDLIIASLGAQIDPVALLSTTWIEPQARECIQDTDDDVFSIDPATSAQILVKPTRTGVRLVYPIGELTVPTPFGDVADPIVPAVIELAVDPYSGTAAYSIDAHYFTGLRIDVPAGQLFNGGVQVTVLTLGVVDISCSDSQNLTPAVGDPSAVSGTRGGFLFVAEFWQVPQDQVPGDGGAGPRGPQSLVGRHAWDDGQGQRHPLPRPWSVELAITGWHELFPTGFWQAVLEEMWHGLVLQQIQDLLDLGKDDPFADDGVPHVDYDPSTAQARWHDNGSGTDWVLTPAPHRRDLFGAMDGLFFDLADVGVGFIPFVGDMVDMAELLYASQTGRDRWGRPVSNWQLAVMYLGAALPFVSVPFIHGMTEAIGQVVERLPAGKVWRVMEPTGRAADFALDEVELALKEPTILERLQLTDASKARRRTTEALAEDVADDAATSGSAGARLADRLANQTDDGWVTVEDVISDDGSGFTYSSLQTAYLRSLRDDPGINPMSWIVDVDG